MKIFNIKMFAVFIGVLCISNVYALDQGTLQVTSITPTQTLATPDGNFDNGWQWIFNVTVPTNEKVVRVKFANWTSGTSTIPTANNVRFYSPQSTNSNSTTTAKTLTSSNVYSDTISLSSSLDLSPSTLGRQIQIVVDVRVPVGTTGGSYASSYGISSDIDPAQATGVVQYTIDPTYEIISVNGNQTNQIIGQVLVTAQNEDVKLNTLTLDPKFSDPNINPTFTGLTNLKLFFNGTQIGSTTSWDLDPEDRPIIFNFDSDVILPVGQQKTITVKSDINFLSSLTVSTGTLNTVIGGLTSNAQGVTTNRLISVFAIPFTLATSTLTNHSALSDVTLISHPDFTTSTTSGSVSNKKIGTFVFQTGSSEGATINTINVTLTGSASPINNLSNLTIKDGSVTIGSPVGTPTSSNNFSTNIQVPTNTTKIIEVYADINSANGTSVGTNMNMNVRGIVSNITKTIETANGPLTNFDSVRISAPDVTFVGGSSPVGQAIIGGSNFSIMTVNVKTSNGMGGGVLKDLVFTSSPSNAFTNVTVNGRTASFSAGQAVIANVGITVPTGISGVNMPVTVNVRCVNTFDSCTLNSGTEATLELSGLSYNNGETNVGITSPTISDLFIADGATPISFGVCTAESSFVPFSANCSFTSGGGYGIAAGTTKTFSLYGRTGGVNGSAGTSRIITKLTPNGFSWEDDSPGGGATGQSGVFLYNFPANSYIKTN